jgi:hypothetical protein
MSDLVSLVVWRDAAKDPPLPEDGWPVMTDQGAAIYVESEGQDGNISGAAWYKAEASDYLDPQPSVWCDPTPPTKDGLTIDHLAALSNLPDAFSRVRGGGVVVSIPASRWAEMQEAAARLRAALPAGATCGRTTEGGERE